MLTVVEPPPERHTADAETASEEAVALGRLAHANPDAVHVPSVLALLDRADESPLRRGNALRALRSVAAERPGDGTPAVPILRSALGSDDSTSTGSPPDDSDSTVDALATLWAVGNDDPADIAPLTDDIVPFLRSDTAAVSREVARCVASIADADPDDAVDSVPALAAFVDEDADGRAHAVFALSCVTREHPEAVEPVAETLCEAIVDESLSDDDPIVRENACWALGHLRADEARSALEERMRDDEEASVRTRAEWTLSRLRRSR